MLESSAGFDPPLDLVHLARQCLGDRELEAELLAMFRLQARGVDGAACRASARIAGIKGEDCSSASWLGPCGRRTARRQRSVANRGIGLGRR